MRRIAIWTMLALVITVGASQPSVRVAGSAETQVTAAGAGVFPDGSSFNGIPLRGSTFGFGLLVYADGSAEGDFAIVLAGTSLLGQAQNITLEGKVGAGVANVDGSVTFSGTAALDMGDGTLPAAAVPFSVTVTDTGLQLTIGTSILPTQTVGYEDIYIG